MGEESSVRAYLLCIGWPFCQAELRREFQTGGIFFCLSLYKFRHVQHDLGQVLGQILGQKCLLNCTPVLHGPDRKVHNLQLPECRRNPSQRATVSGPRLASVVMLINLQTTFRYSHCIRQECGYCCIQYQVIIYIYQMLTCYIDIDIPGLPLPNHDLALSLRFAAMPTVGRLTRALQTRPQE